MWQWFHRVLLGTVLEAFRELGVSVDTASLQLTFDDQSVFQYPAFNNRLLFVGGASATLVHPLDEAGRADLERLLQQAWPDLIQQMRRIPMPDVLTVTGNEITVAVQGGVLQIRFNLEAD